MLEETSGEYQNKDLGYHCGTHNRRQGFKNKGRYRLISTDLGLEWKKFTGLPFVFAAWVSNKRLDDDFIKSFNEANEYGLEKIESVAKENETEIFNIKDYYSRFINFKMNKRKVKALTFFLNKIQ